MSRRACCWNRKKTSPRPRRLVLRWGDSYCAACTQSCEDCPTRLNQPLTAEGWQVWDLVGRLGGQLRALPGAVIGWNLNAAFGLVAALGIPAPAAAELLPIIEAVMVRKMNEQIAANGSGAISFWPWEPA